MEVWRLSVRRPSGGFKLTDDEREEAGRALDAFADANDEVDRVEKEAERHGCHQRSDGRYDERKAIAKSFNSRRTLANWRREQAIEDYRNSGGGPLQRYGTWQTATKAVWSLRFVVVSWIVTYFVLPVEIADSLRETMSEDSAGVFIGAGMASLGLLVIGAVTGSVGYLFGSLLGEAHRPPDDEMADDLARSMRVTASESPAAVAPSVRPASELDASEVGLQEADAAMNAIATATASVLKYIAVADGRFTDEERGMLLAGLKDASKAYPLVQARIGDTVAIAPSSREAVQMACVLLGAGDADFRRSVFTVACIVARVGSGPQEAARLRELAPWLGLTSGEVAACHAEAETIG